MEGVFPEDGVIVPDCDAESPEESVVVGELEGEELTLTVVDGVCELVPVGLDVEVPVSEPLDDCVCVCVAVGLIEEVGVTEYVATDDPVACDDEVKIKLVNADCDAAAVTLVLNVPSIPVIVVIDEIDFSDVDDNDTRPLTDIIAVAELDLKEDMLAELVAESEVLGDIVLNTVCDDIIVTMDEDVT